MTPPLKSCSTCWPNPCGEPPHRLYCKRTQQVELSEDDNSTASYPVPVDRSALVSEDALDIPVGVESTKRLRQPARGSSNVTPE